MKTKTTLILLAIAVLLSVYIIMVERKLPTSDEITEARKNIFTYKPQDITRIELNTPNTSQMKVGATTPTNLTIICTRTADEEWAMLSPIKTKADQTFMNNIAQQLTSLYKTSVINEKDVKDLATYGLTDPVVTAAFTVKDKTHRFKIGKDAPMNRGIYVGVEGDKNIYIIPRYFADLVNKPIIDYRDKQIFSSNIYNTRNFILAHSDKTIELKKEADEWYLAQPISEKANQTKIRELLTAISILEANSFVADSETNLKKYGLDKPTLTLTIIDPTDSAISETLILGSEWEDAKHLAFKQGGSSVFTISKTNYDHLNCELHLLRTKEFFKIDPARLDAIEVLYKQKPVIQITKDNQRKWQFIYPPISATGALPYDVDGLVDKLNKTLVELFISDEITDYTTYGLADPFNDIEVIYTGGSPTATTHVLMSLGRMEGKSPYTYAKMVGEQKLIALNSSIYDYLIQGSTLIRKKSLIDVVFDKVKKISITAEDKDVLTYEQHTPQQWKMIAPKEEELGKEPNLNNLAIELSHLAASEFIADINCIEPSYLSNYGLDKPAITITIDIMGQDPTADSSANKDKKTTTRTLHIGKKTENHYYAMLEDDVIIFKIPKSVVEPINKLLAEPEKEAEKEE